MPKSAAALVFAAGLLALAGCSAKPAPTINTSMKQVMAPQAQVVWDISSAAFNQKGDGLDASKISPTDWDQVEKAGQALSDRAALLAKAKHWVAAGPGEKIMGEEAAGIPAQQGPEWEAADAKKVQAFIDANPALFAQRARVLAEAGDTMVKAARGRDARLLYDVTSNLDEVCDGCHQKFWGTDEPPPFPKGKS